MLRRQWHDAIPFLRESETRRRERFPHPRRPSVSSIQVSDQLHPEVEPQVSHFRQVPLRTMVKLPHSGQASPS